MTDSTEFARSHSHAEGEPETSRAAALEHGESGRAASNRDAVLRALARSRPHPQSAREIAAQTKLELQEARRRLSDLVGDGLVIDSGERIGREARWQLSTIPPLDVLPRASRAQLVEGIVRAISQLQQVEQTPTVAHTLAWLRALRHRA